jgi:uncharacterized protein
MNKRAAQRIIACIVVLLTAFGVSVLVSAECLIDVHYTVAVEGLTNGVRAAVISDLHGRELGKNNVRLIAKTAEQFPDVIFLDGDLIDRNSGEEDVRELERLIQSLCEIAPVFFSLGNHEQAYMRNDDTLLERIEAAGATVVNDSFVDVSIADQTLRIGGTLGYGFYFGRSEEEFTASAEYVFLKEFENTDFPTICLAHRPDTFIFNGAYDMWDIDVVVSGHTHGGLVRLPFVGGLYAPMQGFFPEYDRGYFQLGDNMQMIISSGLAGHGVLPRVNNLPEIVVVDLVPKG